jgi:hypothetical protein
LFDRRQEFRIVARRRTGSTLAPDASHLRPDLIIANMTLLGRHASTTIPEIKHASPHSKLIVTGYPLGLGELALEWGADAYLDEEQLVGRLIPTAKRMVIGRQRHPPKAVAERARTQFRTSKAHPMEGQRRG